MNRYSGNLLLVSLVLLVVSGCAFQLIETPADQESLDATEAPTSYLAIKPEDIVGTWEHMAMGSLVLIRFAEDGTAYKYMGSPPREWAFGNFWFENNAFHFTDEYLGPDAVGIYSVTVEMEDGEPIRLSLSAIDEPDPIRQRDYELGLTKAEVPTD